MIKYGSIPRRLRLLKLRKTAESIGNNLRFVCVTISLHGRVITITLVIKVEVQLTQHWPCKRILSYNERMNSLIIRGNEYDSKKYDISNFPCDDIIDVKFFSCVFQGVSLSQKTIKNCIFFDCKFDSCDLSLVQIVDSKFEVAEFNDCNLIGINWSNALWPNVKAKGLLSFVDCNLSHSTFIGLNLHSTIITKCKVKDVDFRDSDFKDSNFSHSDFNESVFANTNLTSCDFRNAKNYMINLRANKINKAKFNFPEVMSLLYSCGITIDD
jgi:fluoroquinolone resistance protein